MYSRIAANKRKTVFLMLAFVALIGAFGWILAQVQGNPGILSGIVIFAVVYAVIGYFASAKIALGLSGAKPVSKDQAPELYRIVENLSITAGLPMPKVYIINDPAPNAFATGRNPQHSAVAVTTGLLEIMEDEELEGVLAHELSHVGNYDIRVMGIVLVLVTIISFISDFFWRLTFFGGSDEDSRGNAVFALLGVVAAIAAPIIAMLLQLAVSRKREFLADASGALLTRYPEGLARALAKIDSARQPLRRANTATAHLYIASPFGKGKTRRMIAQLFSTHPPTEERIKALHEMETQL